MVSRSTAPYEAASASSTKPNSPAGASESDVRSAVGFSLPIARASANTTVNFVSSIAASTPITTRK